MHITARIFLLRVVDILVEVSRERPITAGGVGVEPTADVDGEVGPPATNAGKFTVSARFDTL
jgi:hypothetical protein